MLLQNFDEQKKTKTKFLRASEIPKFIVAVIQKNTWASNRVVALLPQTIRDFALKFEPNYLIPIRQIYYR